MLKNYPIKRCLIRRNLFKVTFEKLIEAFINFFTSSLPLPSLSQCVLWVRLSAFLSRRVEAALILGFNTRVWWQSSSGLLKRVPLVTPLAVCQPWTRCFSCTWAGSLCGLFQATCVAVSAAEFICLSRVKNPAHVEWFVFRQLWLWCCFDLQIFSPCSKLIA